MIVRCVSYASFIDTIALLVSHERFFHLLLESSALMKLSPLEVDRDLYEILSKIWYYGTLFPSPLEVDRYLYRYRLGDKKQPASKFPAPLEVDRYLCRNDGIQYYIKINQTSFRPLSR